MEKSEDSTFDDVLKLVGDDGYFQKRFNILFNLIFIVLTSLSAFNLLFAMATPEHWCYVPGREQTNFTLEEWKTLTIPKEYDSMGSITYSKCKMFNMTQSSTKNISTPIIDCQNGWHFDKTWYEETVVSQENWVCEKELVVVNAFAFARFGELCGCLVFGQLGDSMGRKIVFFLTLLLLVGGKLATVLSAHNIILFTTTVIIGSVSTTAVTVSPVIISMETSKSERRSKIAMYACISWTIGLSIMSLLMWWLRNWVSFMILSTLPCAIFLFSCRYIIESPRWLMSRGKYAKCVKELKKIAKVNNKEVPEDVIFTLRSVSKQTEKLYGVMSLFSHWRVAKNTIGVVLSWTVLNLSYNVLILNTTNLGGNPFLNFFYQGLAELPAYILGKYSCDYFGRRWTQICFMIVIAVACLPLTILNTNDAELEWVGAAVAIFLKFSISMSFTGVNLQALEMNPTCLRQSGASLGAVSANAFGIIGPYIVYLGTAVDVRYPYAIIAILSVIAACCCVFLPETLHENLPETLKEACEFGANQKYFSWPKKVSNRHEHHQAVKT